MTINARLSLLVLALVFGPAARAADAEYFPPPESKGGWRTLVARNTAPTAEQKAAALRATGLDTDKLVDAWNYLERKLSDLPEFFPTLLAKVMAAVGDQANRVIR